MYRSFEGFFAMFSLPCEDTGEYMSFYKKKKDWENALKNFLDIDCDFRFYQVLLSFYNLNALTS